MKALFRQAWLAIAILALVALDYVTEAGRSKVAYALSQAHYFSGTTTKAPTATEVEDTGQAWSTTGGIKTTSGNEGQWNGYLVVIKEVAGVVVKTEAKKLTIDKWHKLGTETEWGETGATPGGANEKYVIIGQAPMMYLALTTKAVAPENPSKSTSLSEELTANGLERSLATFAYTINASSYTLSHEWTSTDVTTRKIKIIGVFDASKEGTLCFETELNAEAVVAKEDKIKVTETIEKL